MKDEKEKQEIKTLFQKKYNLTIRDLPESKEENVKTADFEYLVDQNRIFVCELKTIQPTIPSKETSYAQDTDTGWWCKADSGPSRISTLIKEGYKQLKSYTEPNILILFNKDLLDVMDLLAAYQGFLPFTNKNSGETTKKYWWRHISNGQIKDIKSKIDLYIWVDAHKKNSVFLVTTRDRGKKIVEKYFT